MLSNLSKQRGMTFIGWIITLALAGLVLLFVAKLTPLYIQDYTIKSALRDVQGDPHLHGLRGTPLKKAILDSLNKRFRINNVEIVKPANIEISPEGQGMNVSINYEAKTSYLANISLLVNFEHQAVIMPTNE